MITPDPSTIMPDSSKVMPDPFFRPDERPYVGLRAFEPSDRRYFCGRSTHIAEVLRRLSDHRFIAVVGLSGSGKSSLVRAGLVPELRADHLQDSGSDWVIAMATPGTEPLKRIGDKLSEAVRGYYTVKRKYEESELPTGESVDRWAESVHHALKSGSLGLAKAIATAGLKLRTRVLLVVDQFEELFRYWKRTSRDGKDEVEVFIQQLLELTSDPNGRVYVVITMRSEYLGDCARYEGLPEAVNAGLYLTPRLKREQLREAIELPAQRCNRQIAPELVQRLVNDVADDQDQLPVLQHALMRCWKEALQADSKIVGDAQYNLIGGPDALNVHAERIFARLGEASGDNRVKSQQIAEVLLKRITKRATGLSDDERKADGTRDATELGIICSQTGFSPEDIIPIVNVFRERNRAFLRPSMDEAKDLTNDSVIDITHESLIRKWRRLGDWVREESNSADLYLELSAEAAKAPSGEFLSQSKLDLYTSWGESGGQTAEWARRYGGDYEQAIAYLTRSRTFQKWKKWKQRASIVVPVAIVVAFLAYLHLEQVNQFKKLAAERGHVIDFEKTAKIVSSDGIPTTFRVPAAIEEAQAAENDSTGKFQQELLQQVRLDQWELFSALRQGKSLDPHRLNSAKVDSGCGVALDQSRQFVALADNNSVKIWDLAMASKTLSAQQEIDPITNVEFPGVDCVRFSPNKKRLLLLASSYSANSLNLNGTKSQVRWWRLSTEKGTLKPTFVESLGCASPIDAPLRISFVKDSTKLSLLTTNKLIAYGVPDEGPLHEQSHKALGSDNGPVQAGAYNAEGTYLVISYDNGLTEIYDLAGKLPPKPLIFTDASHDFLQSVAFSSDSVRIVTGSYLGRVWTQGNPFVPGSAGREPIAQMTGSISAVAIQGVGQKELVAAGTVFGDAAVFKPLRKGEKSLTQGPWLSSLNPRYTGRHFTHFGTVTALSFAENGKELVTASGDQKARVFDVNSGLERTRIAHNRLVVSAVSVKKDGGPHDLVVSTSQDADLEITDLDRDDQTVLLLATDDSCPDEFLSASRPDVWPSVVSAQGLWTWACNGQLHSFGGKKSPDYGNSLPASMHFSQDGTAAAWLDLQLGIHYARWSDKEQQWQITREAWDDIPVGEPKPFSSSATVLAISRGGDFVGISFGTEDNRNVIEVFKVLEDSKGLRLEQLRNGISKSKAQISGSQFRPYGIDAGDRRVLSLAVSSEGSIAAGTVDNTVLRFTRKDIEWVTSPVNMPEDKSGALGPQGRAITAIAFADNVGSGSLAVARGDSSIWFFSRVGAPLYPPKGNPVPGDDAPAQMLVFSKDGKQVAAVEGASVTFFAVKPDGLTKGLTLREPGVIQSIALAEDDVAFTSVVLGDSLLRFKHNLRIEKHVQWVCDKQPRYQDKNSPEEKGCKQLRELRHWVTNSCFWPGTSGNLCSTEAKN